MEAQKFTQFEIPNGLIGLNRNVILNFGINLLGRQDVIDVVRMLNEEDIDAQNSFPPMCVFVENLKFLL
jgi:hypothetical protein